MNWFLFSGTILNSGEGKAQKPQKKVLSLLLFLSG
jgi:hypothetical protein